MGAKCLPGGGRDGLTLSFVAVAQSVPRESAATRGRVLAYEVGEIGPHHRTWKKVVERADPASGKTVRTTNDTYVELATGLNYYDESSGQWKESRAEFEISPEGYAFAQRGQQAHFHAWQAVTSRESKAL